MNVRTGWVRDKGNVWMAIPANVNPLAVPCLVVTDYADAHHLWRYCPAHVASATPYYRDSPCCPNAVRCIVVPLPEEATDG